MVISDRFSPEGRPPPLYIQRNKKKREHGYTQFFNFLAGGVKYMNYVYSLVLEKAIIKLFV